MSRAGTGGDPPALLVRGAVRSFGSVRALDGLDLVVPAGSLLAVLGPSGCGKTTLLRAVAGFERLDAGEISVRGRTVAGPGVHEPPHHRRAAVVPQEGALFPHLDVARNVGYGLDHATRRSGRVAEVLALVGLEGYGHRMPHQLSGGQQQRVAIARALAPRPALILLDEPFTALDAGLRATLRREVREALLADGTTAILVTHDQDEALSMADLVAVQRAGRIVQVDAPHRVYSMPADPWVAGFVGEAALVRGWLGDGEVRTPLGTVPVTGTDVDLTDPAPGPVPVPVTVLVRPEQIELVPADAHCRMTPPGTGGGQESGRLARVVARDYHGHEVLVTLAVRDEDAALAANAANIPGPGAGSGTVSGTTVSGTELRAQARVAGDRPALEIGDQVIARLRNAAKVWYDPSR
ncbi:Fe(3+) ions import ATP-binding protein FbpC 1 [Frankia sp. Hr75.2]|nr:Fe(3+) ions import ATP-binding protein FbpC 1 [Frankia sp. Hr75.2]